MFLKKLISSLKSKFVFVLVSALVVLAFAAGAALAAPQASQTLPDVYYVHSNDPILKALLGVDHQFDEVFSTELTGRELGMLKSLGVGTERVQIRRVDAKPDKCGDGTCQGFETASSCPQDCSAITPTPTPTPTPTTRSCYPDSQKPYGINMVNGGSGGAEVTVAVLDTGINQTHLDLVGRISACLTKVTHFKSDSKDCNDGHGHGTHVAGTVAADGGADGLGIYGVAPEAKIMAIKVCDRRGFCYGDDIAAGIRYAADNDAKVISMSIGGDTADSQELAAIDYAAGKGLLVVAAAGNDGPSLGSIDYPGAYVKVMAAAAIDSSKNVPDWSSRGVNDGDFIIEEREVETGTPGVSVESTYRDGCYTYMSGTSMATPHVSGLAAKYWQGSASSTRTYLQEQARLHDLDTSGDDPATGFGLPITP